MTRALGPRVALVVLAGVVVIAAGCGGADRGATGTATVAAGTTGSGGGASTRGRAVRFAECMRANGVPGFPDPDATGASTIDAVANGSSLDTSSPAFEQALGACKSLEPAGFTGHERSAEEQQGALAFARCIRAHGVKDFPDPAKDEPLVDTRRIPSTDRPGGMAILNSAMGTCSADASAAGVTGGR